MKTAHIYHLAFMLDGPLIDPRDIFVPATIASLILAAVFCLRLPQKVKQYLAGLVAVLFLYPIAVVSVAYAPRMAAASFSLVAFPLVLIAYAAAWRRKLVSVLAVTGIVVFTASPIDVTVAFGAEKKGIHIVPLHYNLGGGFHGSYYSLGCLPPPRSIYSASYVLVLSV